jgi:hypothetical protein
MCACTCVLTLQAVKVCACFGEDHNAVASQYSGVLPGAVEAEKND